MKRRIRLLSGLLALLAFTFSFAEGVWAATCVPGMNMDAAEMSVGAPMQMDGAPAPANAHDEKAPSPERAPDCPFGPATSVQGCTVTASLPAKIVAINSPEAERVALSAATTTGSHLLRVTSIFHPPKF